MKKIVIISIMIVMLIHSESVTLNVLVSNKLTNAPTMPTPRIMQSRTNTHISTPGTLRSYLKNALTIGTLSYVCATSLLYYYSFKVSHSTWIHWKEQLALLQLEHEDKNILAAQLLDDMCLHYDNELCLDAKQDQYTFFKNELTKELEYCLALEALNDKLQLLHVDWLFPFGKKAIANAKHYIRRLLFMKSLLSIQTA